MIEWSGLVMLYFLRDIVLKQLVQIPYDEFLTRHCQELGPPGATAINNPASKRPAQRMLIAFLSILNCTIVHCLVSDDAQRLVHTANIYTNVVLDKKAKFTCKHKFLMVLRTMPDVDKNKTVFTYEEVR